MYLKYTLAYDDRDHLSCFNPFPTSLQENEEQVASSKSILSIHLEVWSKLNKG